MEADISGIEEAQVTQAPEDGGQQAQEDVQVEGMDWQSAIKERDGRIAELEAQVAEAAKSAEAADALRGEIAELKAQGEDQRVEFELKLAGCRNVKAARAVLEDHGGDVSALKEAEPWMFADAVSKQAGKTGLPNAGAAKDADRQMKHWREIAGLTDDPDGQ